MKVNKGDIMIFNIKDYPGDVVMHCKTEEEARDFCEYLDSIGRKWCSKVRYTEKLSWRTYRERTCYCFNRGTFCELGYFLREGYKILEWSDFSYGFIEPVEVCLTRECDENERFLSLEANDLMSLYGGK